MAAIYGLVVLGGLVGVMVVLLVIRSWNEEALPPKEDLLAQFQRECAEKAEKVTKIKAPSYDKEEDEEEGSFLVSSFCHLPSTTDDVFFSDDLLRVDFPDYIGDVTYSYMPQNIFHNSVVL